MCKSVDNNWYLQGGVSTKMLVGGQLSRRSKQLPIRQEPRGDADPLLNTPGWNGSAVILEGHVRLNSSVGCEALSTDPRPVQVSRNSGDLRLFLSPISPRILVGAFRRSFVPGSPWNRRRC